MVSTADLHPYIQVAIMLSPRSRNARRREKGSRENQPTVVFEVETVRGEAEDAVLRGKINLLLESNDYADLAETMVRRCRLSTSG